MIRKLVTVVAVIAASASFYLAVEAWLGSENQRCARFGDLAGECYAPQAIAAFWIGIPFAVAILALAWLAVRRPHQSETQ